MTFAKYQFTNPTEWANYKAQITDNDGNPVDCAIVEIGQICIETDNEGNCITLDDSFAVDIMWYGEIPQSFNTYEVYPEPCGIHVFSGCEDLYEKRYNEFKK